MKTLVQNILAENYSAADSLLDVIMSKNMARNLVELKKAMAAEISSDEIIIEKDEEELNEARRFKVVRVRIRKGKVERRKKVSNVAGYTFRKKGSGPAKLIRMSPMERRKRKLGARRGKIKRRAKAARIQQKMKRVRIKRRSLGLGPRNKNY